MFALLSAINHAKLRSKAEEDTVKSAKL